MDLTKEQVIMLQEIWSVLKYRLVEFIGKTRNRNVSVITSLETIGNDTLKLFLGSTEEDSAIALEFVTFVTDTVILTKSLSKTIDKVNTVYQFSNL